MNQSPALIQPVGRGLLLGGAIAALLLMAGYSPAGQSALEAQGMSTPTTQVREWAPQAMTLEPMGATVTPETAPQRWVF